MSVCVTSVFVFVYKILPKWSVCVHFDLKRERVERVGGRGATLVPQVRTGTASSFTAAAVMTVNNPILKQIYYVYD